MALLPLSDLLKKLTRDEVLASMLAIANTLGLNTTAWQEGQPGRTLLVIVAQRIADLTSVTYEIAAGGLLEYATGEWLKLLAKNVYNVDKIEAKFATGSITLTNTSGGNLGSYAAGELVFAHTVTGKTYRNTAATGIIADASSVSVAIQADEAGVASDAAPAAITTMVTTILGLACSNAASVLGADAETDAQLRQRCRDKLGSLSPNGPAEAYSYAAKTAATSSPITRTKVVADNATGVVTCYCATASGAPSGGDVTIANTAIQKSATPLCVQASAVAAAENTVAITMTVWVQGSSLTTPEIQTAIATKLAAYFQTLPIGGFVIPPASGKVDIDALKGQIFQATPGIVDVSITLPAADVSVATNEVPKLGTVTTTVNVVV